LPKTKKISYFTLILSFLEPIWRLELSSRNNICSIQKFCSLYSRN